MLSFKKILCAVDLSEMSAKVADCATTMAKTFDAEVLVVYVAPSMAHYPVFDGSSGARDNFLDEVARAAEEQMQKVVAEHFSGVRARGKVLTGFPADEILAEVKDWGADLVVMGTQGRKGMELLLFGSVAEKVVKGAEVPVLTVRPDRS